MLRLALIENLRRVAAVIAADRLDRNLADKWADKMTEVAEKDPKEPDSCDRRHGAIESSDGEFIYCRTGSSFAGTRSGTGIAAYLD